MHLWLLLAPAVWAYSTGKTGSATLGCGECHAAASQTSVRFDAEALAVKPGETVPLALLVSTTDPLHRGAGFNVAAEGGTLAAGTNNVLVREQLTHAASVPLAEGAVRFDFAWTAPAHEGTYALAAAANTVDDNHLATGDGWALAEALVVLVGDGCNDLDGDGVTDCAADCDDEDGSRFPGAPESCDGVDHDCDGLVDEPDALDAPTWYLDADADGAGDPTAPVVSCEPPAGYVADASDCDDADALRALDCEPDSGGDEAPDPPPARSCAYAGNAPLGGCVLAAAWSVRRRRIAQTGG